MLDLLEKGVVRAAEPKGEAWVVNRGGKQVILEAFRTGVVRQSEES